LARKMTMRWKKNKKISGWTIVSKREFSV
jgi:hypothetical protein